MIADSESARPSPDLLRVFERELASRVERLRLQRELLERAGDQSAHELRWEAHSIKGAAAIVGEDDLLDALTTRARAFRAPPSHPGAAGVLRQGRTHGGRDRAAPDDGPLVLHIDDDATSRVLVERIFATRGVSVLAARDAEEGMELARTHRPSLILLDLNLPDATGEQVLRGLRERPDTRALPVVVLSGDSEPRRRTQLLELGARDYLTKPFRIHELLSLFDRLCAGRAIAPSASEDGHAPCSTGRSSS